MAVRNTMSELIATVRGLINDTDEAALQFDDQAVQDKLDRYPLRAHHWPLLAKSTYSTGGAMAFLDYYAQMPPVGAADWMRLALAGRIVQDRGPIVVLDPGQVITPFGDWEAGEVLQDGSWNALTPATSDRIGGHWVLATDPRSVVYLTGTTYDVYAAAADLLEMWAAKVTLSYDYSQLGQSLHRSQQQTMLLNMQKLYKRKRRPRNVQLARSDINPIRR